MRFRGWILLCAVVALALPDVASAQEGGLEGDWPDGKWQIAFDAALAAARCELRNHRCDPPRAAPSVDAELDLDVDFPCPPPASPSPYVALIVSLHVCAYHPSSSTLPNDVALRFTPATSTRRAIAIARRRIKPRGARAVDRAPNPPFPRDGRAEGDRAHPSSLELPVRTRD